MDISSFDRTIKKYAPAECMRPAGAIANTTSLDQTVTEAGYYMFCSYVTGYYLQVSNAAINVYPGYLSGLQLQSGRQYFFYLEPGDHFRSNTSNVLVQRFA